MLQSIRLRLAKFKGFLVRRRKFLWMAYQKNLLLDPSTDKRANYWKKCGAHINGKVNIGYDVYFDASNAGLITIDEGAWITARCLLICHKRDMSQYNKGDDINKVQYVKAPIHICKGVHVGMGSIIMPGVTIGEGAIIGAGSVVTRSIPAWTIAVGSPAKVIKEIQPRLSEEKKYETCI